MLPGDSRVANIANDVQMVSRGFATSDNNRLATTRCWRWLPTELQVQVHGRPNDNKTKRRVQQNRHTPDDASILQNVDVKHTVKHMH